ncbi:MAG: RidA family protein [Cyanobacteriota bacterium]
MTDRTLVSTGTPWEKYVGYSRAIRVGSIVEVAGTVAADEQGQVVGCRDPYGQTRFILSKIERALKQVGAELTDVVRTRIYVTNMAYFEGVGRAHGEVFGEIRPASTMVQVSALASPEFWVEIEVSAIVSN